ncbi:MAG: alpha/beta hydrolase [Chloroflexota bacterium]|jgi:epsilon-lactone hydrolase|nr:alpha/beta hydrolase [Chloroflexota bacterium]
MSAEGRDVAPFAPPERPGLQSRLWRQITRLLFRYMANPALPPGVRRRRMDRLIGAAPLPRGTRVEPVMAGSVPAEWIVPPGVETDAVLLYLHGGGYAAGSFATHRLVAEKVAQAASTRALLPAYRLAPEHRFPAAVDDALAVYRWLIQDHGADPARVVVAGDSAGGGLTIALAVSVRDAGKPLPAALVCISPWTDLAGTGASMRTKAGIDPCFTPEDLRLQAREYLGDADPMQPLASPLYADLCGLPPLLAQVGEDEVLLDDARRLVERAQAAGVDATLEVWPGLWHIFATQGTFPESRQAMQRLGSFLGHRLAARVAAIPATHTRAEKTATG